MIKNKVTLIGRRGFISLALVAVIVFVVAISGSFGLYYVNNLVPESNNSLVEELTEETINEQPTTMEDIATPIATTTKT